ncbi:MAG: EAL domain-containing protein, partial [Oscillospiraceae bacterium]|nr:EAL domain-containing protein [Oscillospiraceae bacterium]
MLLGAYAEKQIIAYFQPEIRTLTGSVCGCEALARWILPDGTMIPPAEFVPVLERHDLIHKLDLAILDRVCDAYLYLESKDISTVPFSINLSRIDFYHRDMQREITEVL